MARQQTSTEVKGQKGSGAGLLDLWRYSRTPPKEPTGTFEGKTVLVTGANSGLGLEAAIKIITHDASSLIIAVRTLQKGETAKSTIIARTGCDASRISILRLDMSSFSSVQDFVRNLNKHTPRLDVAVLNAGVFMPRYEQSADGWEMSLQVNALSTTLLAVLLLPLLRRTYAENPSHRPVLEIVSSSAFADVEAEWLGSDSILQHVNDEKNFEVGRQYHISKLLVQYSVASLASLTGSVGQPRAGEPLILSVEPGMCKTDIGRGLGLGIKAAIAVLQAFVARTAEEGARAFVSGTERGGDAHGRMWVHDAYDARVSVMEEGVYEGLRKRVWGEVRGVLEKQDGFRI